MPDVEISFHPGKTEAPVIKDAKLHESVPAGREVEGLETMDTTTLWITLEELYQESSQVFSDPYQYTDTREHPPGAERLPTTGSRAVTPRLAKARKDGSCAMSLSLRRVPPVRRQRAPGLAG